MYDYFDIISAAVRASRGAYVVRIVDDTIDGALLDLVARERGQDPQYTIVDGDDPQLASVLTNRAASEFVLIIGDGQEELTAGVATWILATPGSGARNLFLEGSLILPRSAA